jgi:hypothetical protein
MGSVMGEPLLVRRHVARGPCVWVPGVISGEV